MKAHPSSFIASLSFRMEFDRPVTLLVVADAPRFLPVLTTLLTGEGYRVLNAADTAGAYARLQQENVDLIIIDDQFGGDRGYALGRELNADRIGHVIPLIYLVDGTDPMNAYRSGGSDFVFKPIRPQVLSARVRTHILLALARERLARQVEEYETLLHVLGHDLMNPVSAMRGFLALAKGIAMSEEQAQIYGMVDSCLKHQEDIILSVRDLRALESGKIALPLDPVRLVASIESSLALFQTRMQAKQIAVETEFAPDSARLHVVAEPVALVHHVISNVISNAIKFSYPGGGIHLAIVEEPPWVALRVSDQGMGMPAELLRILFRVDKSTSRSGTAGERGTGFGMPLVKKYVERFGGRIEVESSDVDDHKDRHGTTVTLRFQKAPAPA